MARTALTVQTLTVSGLEPTFTAANADGHSIVNDGRAMLYVKNGSGASITVTISGVAYVGGVQVGDLVITVPAGSEVVIPPLQTYVFNQSDGSGYYVDFSAVSSVTVAAWNLP